MVLNLKKEINPGENSVLPTENGNTLFGYSQIILSVCSKTIGDIYLSLSARKKTENNLIALNTFNMGQAR